MSFIRGRSPRQTLWLILAAGGAVVMVGAAVWLWRLARRPTEELSSLVIAALSLVVGIGHMCIALLHFFRSSTGLARSAGDPVPVGDPLDAPRAGMVSLATPDGLLVARILGRDQLIDKLTRVVLHRSRHQPGVHVLHGMGGSGKTTVALAVARQARDNGVAVWWISAATVTAMETGLRQLLRRLGATDQELRLEWTECGPDLLWRRLANVSTRWLLIIDNADDIHLLSQAGEMVADQRGWIRPVRSRHGTIIVTSRDGKAATWGAADDNRWCVLHHVGMLSDADSAAVLLDRAGRAAGSPADAVSLGARLGGLPLALHLAGAYLADTRDLPLPGAIKTFAAYREALEAGRLEAVFEASTQALTEETARGIIDRTWELSLDLLRQRDLDLARPLLRLLAMFADAPIPYQLVLNPATLAGTAVFADIDLIGLRRLLHGLDELSLIDVDLAAPDGPQPTVRLHPLIRATCRHHVAAASDTTAYVAIVALLLRDATRLGNSGAADDPHSWSNWAALTPHVLATFHAVQEGIADARTRRHMAEAAVEVARYQAEVGQYAAARETYRDLVSLAGDVYGETHLNTLAARANLGLWTGHAGDAAAARAQFADLVSTMDGVLGPSHPATLSVRANLADWTGHSGSAMAACTQFSDLAGRYDRLLGAEHADTLAVRANLAWWTGVAGHARAARDQFAALLPLRRKILGPVHPSTLTASANLALWTGAAGDFEEALSRYSGLLPTFVEVFGTEHPSTLSVRANLARWTGNSGDVAKALEMYQQLRPTVERVLGGTHPATLVLRANIAMWTGASGDPAGAYAQFAHLLPIRMRVSGAEHPSTVVVRANLAFWAIESDRAVTGVERADLMALAERILGDSHPTTVTLRAQFGRGQAEPLPKEIAAALYNSLIPIVERITGAEHPRTMTFDGASPSSR